MRTFLSWADAVGIPNAITEAIANPVNFKIVRIIPSPVESTAEVGRASTFNEPRLTNPADVDRHYRVVPIWDVDTFFSVLFSWLVFLVSSLCFLAL
jgi:hypothetical protein